MGFSIESDTPDWTGNFERLVILVSICHPSLLDFDPIDAHHNIGRLFTDITIQLRCGLLHNWLNRVDC